MKQKMAQKNIINKMFWINMELHALYTIYIVASESTVIMGGAQGGDFVMVIAN